MFNLGNILLLAATAICGMSVAFPVALGIGLVVGAVLEFAFNPQASLLLVSAGVLIVIIGVLATIMAYSWRQQERAEAAQKPLTPDPRARNAKRSNPSWKGIVLAVFAGLVSCSFLPMVATATVGETGRVSLRNTALLVALGGNRGVEHVVRALLPVFSGVGGGGSDPRVLYRYYRKQHVSGNSWAGSSGAWARWTVLLAAASSADYAAESERRDTPWIIRRC